MSRLHEDAGRPVAFRRPISLVRSLLAAVTVLVTAVGSGLLSAAPAYADNFGSTAGVGTPTNCVSLANNAYHVIRWDGAVGNQIPNLDEAVLWTLGNVYNPTDLVAYRAEGDSLPDVWVHDYDYGYNSGFVGWIVCSSDNTGTGGSHPNRWCRGPHARFNSYYYTNYSGFFGTDAQSRNVACHEIGHTLGLRHRTDTRSSCMWTYAGDGGGSTHRRHDHRGLCPAVQAARGAGRRG